MYKFSYLKSLNADYIEQLHQNYLNDPDSIDESWRYLFDGLELRSLSEEQSANSSIPIQSGHASANSAVELGAEAKVAELIYTYRLRGNLISDLDPLNAPPSQHPFLELSNFELTAADLEKTFQAGKLIGMGPAKLKDIIARLKRIYSRTIAVEMAHIQDPAAREWIRDRVEKNENQDPNLTAEDQIRILKRLTESETFERFIGMRYVAQKRFSIEGSEALIPALDTAIDTAADLGAKEIVVGMAHRGRLNVLFNTFGKKPEYLFTEFEGTYAFDPTAGEGDVKYHKGYSADLVTANGKEVHLSLASNPSHLEFINAVVEGVARAKQDRRNDQNRSEVIPFLIHGDAAFAGQGVCYETLNLSQLQGYATGGTLHVVINNQVGFTADVKQTRSTPYATDLAKMLDCPIFHVNGDDVEALCHVMRICVEFRQKFKRDAFIDLICYRKHGHNEGDEPAFTQPLMYKKIKAHAGPRAIYAEKLVQLGVLKSEDADKLVDEQMERFTEAQKIAKEKAPYEEPSAFQGAWKGLRRPENSEELFQAFNTSVSGEKLKSIAQKINTIPTSFNVHPKLVRFFEARLKAVGEGKGIDWGNGEALAYASLIQEGFPVRISGQDVERGTFSHRHSVLHDTETGELFLPFNQVAEGRGTYEAYNSHLSETGVLGFEYGYSNADPNTLVIWEAQFGDFANGAQVIIDQFISSGESKWKRMSGLVLLLPHGYEGQGPEHSSARLERFLNLCGRNNMAVCNLSTPANLFHALRRQMLRPFRKPLIIMSPKSLLRNPQAVSDLKDLSEGRFQEVIDDPEITDPAQVRSVLLCSGKVYYDLLVERESRNITDVAVVRLEQIYPFAEKALATILNRYSNASRFTWVQEEPRNMGAWSYIFNHWMGGYGRFSEFVGEKPIYYAGRETAAAPAVGVPKLHETEQKALLEKAFL